MKTTKAKPKKQKYVVLFTAPSCQWCAKVKALFHHYNITYKSVDVSRDKKARLECEKHGCRGIPVVKIGNTWICGYDEQKVKKELDIKG